MEDRKLFRNKLRALRIEAGLTQTDLANRVGVSVSYINKIEKGVLPPPSETLISELALVLNIDKDKLLEVAEKIPVDISQALRAKALKYFGTNLKELRVKANLSQYQFARRIGVDPSYINKIENGTMPPPSKRLLLRMPEILDINKDELLFLAGRLKANRTIQIKNSLKNFKDKLTSKTIRGMDEFGNVVTGVSAMNARSFLRVTVALLLVVAVGSSLWLAAPHPVQALTIGVTAPSSATIGSPYQITVLVTVQSADILPIQSAYLDIKSSTNPSTYKARCTNLPLTNGGTSTSISALGTSGTAGTVSVTAATGSNWAYADPAGSRSGYGYGYGIGWGTQDLGSGFGYGYGYGGIYTGGSTTITYTINWTPPSDWPAGTYTTEAFVVGSGTVSFVNDTTSSFTLSAAAPAPAPAPAPGAGEPPPTPTRESVADVVDEDGVFTSLFRMESEDGNVHLSIPRGTTGLTAEGEPLSRIEITEVRPAPVPPAGTSFLAMPYDLEPSGATFDPPIILTFEYDPDWIPPNADPENLTIAYYDEDAGEWVELDAADFEVDPATNTITCNISHFTNFAILVRVAPAEFTVGPLHISPLEAGIAQRVEINTTVTNVGDRTGSYELVCKINGKVVAIKKVTLAGGEVERVLITTVQGKPGSYKVEIDGLSETFTVKAVTVEPVVIAPSVPQVVAPEVEYPAPTAPAPTAVPAPVPAPTPWLPIIIVLVVMGIVAGILVWNYGFRRT